MRTRLAALLLLAAFPLAGCLDGDGPAGPDGPADGSADVALLSPVRFDSRVRETFDVPSSVDGVPLRVDAYKPPGDGPFPTILVLSPYWAFLADAKAQETPTWYIDYFVPRGYAVALGEMRGTRDSGGCWDFGGRLDQMDGHDIVEGLAALPWSNGRVGMLGQSHVGMSQLAAAITAPPHLTTIVPIAAVSDWYRYLHKDGAPYVLNRGTPPAYFAVHANPSQPPVGGEGTTPAWVLTQAQTACADNLVHLSQSAELDGDKDAYWQERDLIAGAGNVKASVFMVHGFRDENVKTDHFLDFWNALPPAVERKAWFGQWYHEHPFFDEWRTDLHQWFDHWLMGIGNGILSEPRVVVQDNLGWDDDLGYNPLARNATAWPPAVETQAWVLDGALLRPGIASQEGAASSVSYVAVPGDDRPGPHASMPYEVAFRSDPLAADLHLAGEPTLALSGALTGPGGRWIAVLFDEAPSGARDEVTRAYLDARHRDGLEAGQDVPPGPHGYLLRFFPRDHVVPAGHRLVLALLAGDMGCQGSGVTEDSTCEGTGIVPWTLPVTHVVETGPGSPTRLWLPVTDEPAGSWELTRLEGWLEDQPR